MLQLKGQELLSRHRQGLSAIDKLLHDKAVAIEVLDGELTVKKARLHSLENDHSK